VSLLVSFASRKLDHLDPGMWLERSVLAHRQQERIAATPSHITR
jgi:hypothetical protein